MILELNLSGGEWRWRNEPRRHGRKRYPQELIRVLRLDATDDAYAQVHLGLRSHIRPPRRAQQHQQQQQSHPWTLSAQLHEVFTLTSPPHSSSSLFSFTTKLQSVDPHWREVSYIRPKKIKRQIYLYDFHSPFFTSLFLVVVVTTNLPFPVERLPTATWLSPPPFCVVCFFQGSSYGVKSHRTRIA